MVIVSPVRGFRPSRAPRSATWNLPKPVKLTSSPEPRAVSISLITASTAEPASFLLSSARAATRSTNSFFVMRPPVYPVGGLGWRAEANSGFGRGWGFSREKFANCDISTLLFGRFLGSATPKMVLDGPQNSAHDGVGEAFRRPDRRHLAAQRGERRSEVE